MGGTPSSLDGFFDGKFSKMDDDWGYLYFRKPPSSYGVAPIFQKPRYIQPSNSCLRPSPCHPRHRPCLACEKRGPLNRQPKSGLEKVAEFYGLWQIELFFMGFLNQLTSLVGSILQEKCDVQHTFIQPAKMRFQQQKIDLTKQKTWN